MVKSELLCSEQINPLAGCAGWSSRSSSHVQSAAQLRCAESAESAVESAGSSVFCTVLMFTVRHTQDLTDLTLLALGVLLWVRTIGDSR